MAMPEALTIQATLEPRGPAGALVLSDEQVEQLGGGRRPPVRVTVKGETFRGRVSPMGGENLIGFSKAVRAQTGVEVGDAVDARIELDDAPRTVDVPEPLERALARDAEARAAFDALAYTHRREYAEWIAGAKRDQTRERRVAQALEMLRQGRTRS
jgi:hypothetical protein